MNNTTTDANETIVLFDLYSSTAKIIGYSLAYGLLSLIALFGNAMVLMVVTMNKSMRTTINVLLMNLSFSDILYILLSAPGYLSTEICNQRWLLGLGMAIVSQFCTILSPAASVFTLMAIAFERYFAIMHPLKDRVRNRKSTTIWALVLIWICSIAFALPFALGSSVTTFPLHVKRNGQVTLQDITFLSLEMEIKSFRIYYLFIFVGLHIVPFVMLVVLYMRIAWKLWHPERQLSEQPAGATGTDAVTRMSERIRRRTTVMVIAVLAAFFICFFPFHIYFITRLFSADYEPKPTDETSILRIFLLLNAAINPVIYNLLSEKFHVGFRRILAACCSRRRPRTKTEASVISLDAVQSVSAGHSN